MSTASRLQAGFKAETTYGTPVTVDRFMEFVSDNVTPRMGRIPSKGMASGRRVASSSKGAVYRLGADGTVTFEVLSKGFGFWLNYMLGSVATAGPVDSKSTHTGTVGALAPNKSFTYQSNRPFTSTEADQAFTFEGGKIKSWTLSNDAEGLLMCSMDLDFEDWKTATALASASYPTATENFSFTGAAITVGAVEWDVSGIEITVDNKLNVDRRFLRNANALKKEPLENDLRGVSVNLKALDFDDLTSYNYFSSATLSGSMGQLVATWTAPTLIGVSSFPTVVVTVDNLQFTTWQGPDVSDASTLQQGVTGTGFFNSSSAVTIAYGTADATP